MMLARAAYRGVCERVAGPQRQFWSAEVGVLIWCGGSRQCVEPCSWLYTIEDDKNVEE